MFFEYTTVLHRHLKSAKIYKAGTGCLMDFKKKVFFLTLTLFRLLLKMRAANIVYRC